MSEITIREERPADIAAIREVTRLAFEGLSYSDGSEPRIIDRLREDGDLVLSLVAEDAGGIIGHIALSAVEVEDGTAGWFGLGPISVLPDKQRSGIGSLLMTEAINRKREREAKGIVLLGDPAYYRRFGFVQDPKLTYPGPPPEYFQRLVLAGDPPTGEVRYAAAFG